MVTALTNVNQNGIETQTDHIVLPYICTYGLKISKYVSTNRRYIKILHPKFSMKMSFTLIEIIPA